MNRKEALFMRDELRVARNTVLQDAEAFAGIIFALERLGSFIAGRNLTLKKYETALLDLAEFSPLATDVPTRTTGYHHSAKSLYSLVRQGRNEALHQGVYARHLARHAVELSLILEDALVREPNSISELMVRDPVCAELWQPLSYARHQMLVNSYSYLPIKVDLEEGTRWHVLSDFEVARVLRSTDGVPRSDRLVRSIGDSIETLALKLSHPHVVSPTTPVTDAIRGSNGGPVLVVDDRDHLLGLVTPFDFL